MAVLALHLSVRLEKRQSNNKSRQTEDSAKKKVLFKLTIYNWLKLSECHMEDCRTVHVSISD